MTPVSEYTSLYVPSLELIVLFITLVIDGVITLVVYQSNRKSATNKIFSLLSIFTMLWLITNFLVRSLVVPETLLVLHRLGIFLAAPMSSLFFLLAHTMPAETIQMKRRSFYLVIGLTVMMMAINISPYAFLRLDAVGGDFEPHPGPGLIPFSVISTAFSILAVYWLFRKYRRSDGAQKKQLKLVLLGIIAMLTLIIATVLVPIIVYNSAQFLIFTPLYTLIFLGMTAYAIVKYRLFNLKVIATEALTAVLWAVLISKVVVSDSTEGRIVDTFIFAISVVFGILLIKSVRREVKQREELQKLNLQLEDANKKLEELSRFKTQLLSLASHQIKSPLAAIKGFISLVSDGLYGPVDAKIKEVLSKVKISADGLIDLINNLLDLRRVDEGKMDYHFEKTGLSKLIQEVISVLQPLADSKKLSLTFSKPEEEVFLSADGQKLKQVIQNLVDNAIKYTPSGFVKVELKKESGRAQMCVGDSGLGISKELLPMIFEEFVRDERVKAKILGTGLGLYIARKIIEAHGGRIWAESEGEGRGSKFFVSLPVA